MGTTCCYLNFLSSLEAADWIAILGVIINAGLAIWIVRTIQNKLTNRRILKDHFINEIKEIRNEYKSWLNSLYSNNTHPLRVIPWFKLMNIKVDNLMSIANAKYGINKSILRPYQIELPDLITNNPDFVSHFKKDKIVFSEQSRSQLIMFQQTYNQLFNEIIISINDAT